MLPSTLCPLQLLIPALVLSPPPTPLLPLDIPLMLAKPLMADEGGGQEEAVAELDHEPSHPHHQG